MKSELIAIFERYPDGLMKNRAWYSYNYPGLLTAGHDVTGPGRL